jgi:hypothetical protein
MLELTLNGATSGNGFLISPSGGQVFSGTLSLRITAGLEIDVMLRTADASAAPVFFDTAMVHASATETNVKVHGTNASAVANDTIIEAVAGTTVLAQLKLTVVQKPAIRYSGRFQCRLATDPDPFNHQWGVHSSFGMYSVEGPDPMNPDELPLDRIIRFQDAVALRPFSEPVGVTVTAIEAMVGGANTLFNVGDSILDLPVRLGPNCKLESQDGAFAQPGFEPISDFEFHIAGVLSGRSGAAAPRNLSDPPSTTAPYADGLYKLDEIGPWKPSDFGYPEPTWTLHAAAVATAKKAALDAQVPGSPVETRIRDRRLQEYTNNVSGIRFAQRLIERYFGTIDNDINVVPGTSTTLAYFASAPSWSFVGEFFNFDTDLQCGTVTGTIAAS